MAPSPIARPQQHPTRSPFLPGRNTACRGAREGKAEDAEHAVTSLARTVLSEWRSLAQSSPKLWKATPSLPLPATRILLKVLSLALFSLTRMNVSKKTHMSLKVLTCCLLHGPSQPEPSLGSTETLIPKVRVSSKTGTEEPVSPPLHPFRGENTLEMWKLKLQK